MPRSAASSADAAWKQAHELCGEEELLPHVILRVVGVQERDLVALAGGECGS